VGVVQQVVRDQERGAFINVIIKPAANLQHLDEVLVITSLDPHLSPEQMADIQTSEQLKGAEVAADAARKKAAAEMAERLPSLKDPNAPDADGKGTDGKAEESKPTDGPPLPPVTPRPIAAKHPDRFSPGGAQEPSPRANVPDSPDAPVSDDDTAKPNVKPTQPKPGTKPGTKPAPKPANPKPNTGKPASKPQGGTQ
jgi:rod shape-determining protein MreC